MVEGKPGLLAQLAAFSDEQILSLRAGVQRAAHWFRYYAERRVDTGKRKMDPLLEGES